MNARQLTNGSELHTMQAGGFVVIDTVYEPLVALPRHGHAQAALFFASRGSFEETADGRTFECATYDVIARPPAVRHSNRYDATGTRCVLISVPDETLLRLQPFTPLFESTRQVPRERGYEAAARIYRELTAQDQSSPIVVEGLVLELIGAAARARRGDAPRWLRDARDYIHAHWSEQPALDDIARAGGVHRASLVRGFRSYLSCSPGEYLRRLRLEHARQALASDRPIAEIALEAGFYDQSHFTTAFRRRFGMTPAAYRFQTRA